jgi:hypothetical protein
MAHHQFRFLYHVTQPAGLASVLRSGVLRAAGSDGSGGSDVVDQFPGAYLNACLAHHVELDWTFGDVCLVFPLDLMTGQSNWHFNIIDQNGHINANTYARPTLSQLPDMREVERFYGTRYPGNELVMHDDVDLRLLSAVWVKGTQEAVERVREEVARQGGALGRVPVVRAPARRMPAGPVFAEPRQRRFLNRDARPVLTFRLDFHYTGAPFPRFKTGKPTTPIAVYRKLAENAGVPVDGRRGGKREIDRQIAARLRGVFARRPPPVFWPPFSDGAVDDALDLFGACARKTSSCKSPSSAAVCAARCHKEVDALISAYTRKNPTQVPDKARNAFVKALVFGSRSLGPEG